MAPNWKPVRGTAKRERRARKDTRDAKELLEKKAVRRRDRVCRFPLCGCRRAGLALHVSHVQHKGAGGNPAGDRSVRDLMVLVCVMRHRESRFAIDQQTIRWRALTAKGADGPIVWEADRETLLRSGCTGNGPEPASWATLDGGWLELARESAPGKLDPTYGVRRAILEDLARMNI